MLRLHKYFCAARASARNRLSMYARKRERNSGEYIQNERPQGDVRVCISYPSIHLSIHPSTVTHETRNVVRVHTDWSGVRCSIPCQIPTYEFSLEICTSTAVRLYVRLARHRPSIIHT